jgi:hypothetical protein
MTDQQHPIVPPPELVQEWLEALYGPLKASNCDIELATRAAQWGADQELKACCEWIADWYGNGCGEVIHNLRAARRPKPPSPAEEALEAAQRFYAKGHEDCTDEEVRDDFDIIRRALERLQELEGQGDG